MKKRLPDISADPRVSRLIRDAVREDVGRGDVTTGALVPRSVKGKAAIIARGECVVSGCAVARAVFGVVDAGLKCAVRIPDGRRARPGETVMTISGRAAGILTAERTALNFMQRMTGMATLTSRFVARVGRWGAMILDTRKTTPGMRVLEKYAVLCGGGTNHRMGLYDKVLIKDNHRRLWRAGGMARLDEAVCEARRRFPGMEVEVEVETVEELLSAMKARPDWVLLDNMTQALMRKCVRLVGGHAKTEASGGITLANVARVAATGVDAISLGCLTHSAPAADLSLEME